VYYAETITWSRRPITNGTSNQEPGNRGALSHIVGSYRARLPAVSRRPVSTRRRFQRLDPYTAILTKMKDMERATEPKLIRTTGVELLWDGNQVCALVGPNLQEGNAGFGDTAEEALADLIEQLKTNGVTLWVPHWAKAFIDAGVMKAICPECGHIRVFPDFERVYMYICDGCGNGTKVDNSALPVDSSDNGEDSSE
jgi:hypothetical protein